MATTTKHVGHAGCATGHCLCAVFQPDQPAPRMKPAKTIAAEVVGLTQPRHRSHAALRQAVERAIEARDAEWQERVNKVIQQAARLTRRSF